MQFMVVNMMMTVPILIFWEDEEVFLDVVSTKPFFCLIFFVQFFFCRWIGFDLQNMDFVGNYPTEEKVEDWLTHYLTQFNGERPDMQACSCLQNTLKDLRAEVQRFSKVNHLVWSTWSVIQAVSSSIDYDYFEYARIRLGEYLKLKTEQ